MLYYEINKLKEIKKEINNCNAKKECFTMKIKYYEMFTVGINNYYGAK